MPNTDRAANSQSFEHSGRKHPTPNLPPNYSALQHKTRVGFYVIQRGRFSRVSDRLATMLGFDSPDQLAGKSVWEMIHPDDRHRFNLRSGRKSSQTHSYDEPFRIMKEDGSSLTVNMQGVNTVYNGKPANMGCLIDMSAIHLLKSSIDKYQTMISEVEDGVGELDLTGTITYVNVSGCKAWGGDSQESVGMNYKDYVDEKYLDHVLAAYREVYYSGEPKRHIHYDMHTKDGGLMSVEDSVTPIRDCTGAITGFRAVSRNLTDLKKMKKNAVEQRMRLSAIFQSVQDAVIMVTPEMRIIEANTSAESICNLDVTHAAGKLISRCFPQCKRACHRLLRRTIEKRELIKEQRVECAHEQHRRQAASVSSVPLLDHKNRFIGAVLIIRDITRLMDLEQELRQRHQFQNIISKNQYMLGILKLVEKLADLETTVTIIGESGTGKELVARALHYSGKRSAKPFVTVNCSALAESLLESELFGHVKGAFTGASQDRAGRFQTAEGGTILLDEIGDVSPLIQLKLLRVLQEKEYERVGESVPRKADVRVIVSTHRNLKQMVQEGEFREDLYYRLKVVQIDIPPLRERIEDIPLLVEHFCHIFNKRFNKTIEVTSDEVLNLLSAYPWPGNVRELEHVMERAFVLCHGRVITIDHLPSEIINLSSIKSITTDTPSLTDENAQRILDALNKTFWNKSKAARLLGISRDTLYRKIQAYDLLDKI